ncbi:ATP-binding protein [Salana multivorans]
MASLDLTASDLVETLRAEGSDVTDVEAKRARDGYPEDLPRTLSAFANLPGGGVIMLGLDERDGFSVTGVYDVADAQQRLAAQARNAVEPPLRVGFESQTVDEKHVVVARVSPLSAAQKPCIVKSSGRAYLRSYDGDYALSEQEFAAFVAERGAPRYDREPIPESSLSDLDPPLVASYLATARSHSTRLASMSDDEVLAHTRVIAPNGEVTLGGLYALGRYPQTFIPTLSMSARVAPRPGDPPGTRSADLAHFDGPLPEILDQALTWVRRNTSTRVRFGSDGHGRDEPTYPSEALRELIANALVHRDLGPHALGARPQLVLEVDQLVIANPGGLYGITVDQLGTETGGSARNQSLYDIAKDVRTADGRRVIEGVGTGIRAARQALHSAGMTPPSFFDAGIRFTAILPQHALLDPGDLAWLAELPHTAGLSDVQQHALVAMRHDQAWTNKSLRDQFPMDSTRARSLLVDLVDRGLARAHGDRGTRSYSLDPEAHLPRDQRTPSLFDHPGPAAGTTRPNRSDDRGLGSSQPRARTKNAGLIASVLSDGPATSTEISRRTGLSVRQVLYALGRMEAGGLIRINGGQGRHDTTYARAEHQRGS